MNNQPNIKHTQKKFYNKWIFKSTLVIKGAGIFRTTSLSDVRKICLASDHDNHMHYYGTHRAARANTEQIIQLVEFLEKEGLTEHSKRIEGAYIDFYTNDRQFYESINKEFSSVLRHGFEPAPGFEDVLLNGNKVLTKKLPHDKYKFKVYLLPHKLKGDIAKKESFISWAETQDPRILMSDTVKTWFIKTDWNWDRRYVLVEDEQTLFMMQLRSAEVIGKVHEYQLVDK